MIIKTYKLWLYDSSAAFNENTLLEIDAILDSIPNNRYCIVIENIHRNNDYRYIPTVLILQPTIEEARAFACRCKAALINCCIANEIYQSEVLFTAKGKLE